MDFDDEDIFMDMDPKILPEGQQRSNEEVKENFLDKILFGEDGDKPKDHEMKKSVESKKSFGCQSKSISKSLCVDKRSLVGFVCNVLSSNSSSMTDDGGNYITLFDFLFEKSTALHKCTNELFNFTFTTIYELEFAISSQNIFSDCKKSIQNVLQFFKYIIYYIETYSKHVHVFQDTAISIWNNFHQLKLSLKSLKCIGSSVIDHQSLCQQQLHMYLNIHLYYLITVYKLLSIERSQDDIAQCTQYTSDITSNSAESYNFNISSLKNDILFFMIQLTELTLKSFNKISQPEDVYHFSPFKCDCIMEFWFILKLLCGKIHQEGKNELFWKNLETIFELVEKSSDYQNNDAFDSTSEHELLPTYITCSKPYLFIIWFLKHLLSLDVSSDETHQLEQIEKFTDDCEYTEKIVKKLTNVDTISENELRIILTFLNSIVSSKATCKPDIITSLWEYFHKRLNSNFILKSMPFAYSLSSLNCNRSVLELLTYVEQLITVKIEKGEDNSYSLFLRMLGVYLLKYNHEQRVWNQIKGRMYSKFSQNKLSTLSEQGIQHLCHLFVLLFYVKGNQELAKIQTFLNIISSMKDRDSNAHTTREILFKTNLAFILISIRNHVSVDNSMITPVLNFLNQNPSSQNSENMLRIYLLTVKDIVNESEDLALGQHQLLGSWIEKVLSTKMSAGVTNVLFNVFTLVLNKLRPYHPIDKDSQLASYFMCAHENVLPNLQTEVSFNANTLESMTEFLAAFTLFSISGGVNYKHEATLILNKLLVRSSVNFELKMNYVKRLISCEDMQSFSLMAFIPNIETIVTQCYLLSLILSEQEDGDGLRRYVEAHCLQKMKRKYSVDNSQSLKHQIIFSSNEETLTQFLSDLSLINSSIGNTETRNQFHCEVNTLFSIEETLKHIINTNEHSNNTFGKTIVTKTFTSVAVILDHIGNILYKKSKPNSQLQCFLDTLLLQFQVRTAEYKLTASTTHALRCSFHIYLKALMKLDPSNDMYISRVIRELLLLYLPRLVNKTPYETRFSLIKCFNKDPAHDAYLLNLLNSLFIRKKCKVSDKNTHECLVFLQELLNENTDVLFASTFLQASLELLLNNLVSLNEVDVCRNKIRTLLSTCFSDPTVQVKPSVKNHVMIVLTKLCNENLAFSFGPLFQVLNFLLQSCCPGIVAEFRRQVLAQKIKAVEMKRGVGEDKVLRNHLEQLDRNIRKVLLITS